MTEVTYSNRVAYYPGLGISLEVDESSPYVDVYLGDMRFTRRRQAIATYEKSKYPDLADKEVYSESVAWYARLAEEIALEQFIRKNNKEESK